MVIESIAAASATLSAINGLISQVNETGQGVHQVMGMISDFGEGITEFEARRRQSTFKPLTQNEILKLQMLKKQQELDRQDHLRMIARKKKARQHLTNQILVGGTTLLIGGAIIAMGFVIMLRVYG